MSQAARIADPIGHSPTMSWLLKGLLIGAAIAVAGVAIVGTGGLAAVAIVGGTAAMGAGLGEMLSTMSWAPKEIAGAITGLGALNVFTNGRPAARAHLDFGMCSKHPQAPALIATGSATVFINSMPAARVDDKTICSAVITSGSSNVFIGGATVQTDQIAPEDLVPGWVHASLLVVGLGAAVVLGGPALAAVGLVAGFAGGWGANWLGGKLFGEGSDGQKWSALGGGFLAGMLGAKGLGAWNAARAPQPTVSIFGFRGAGRIADLDAPDAPHPYQVTGHVGYSFDGGKTIYGFGPEVGEMTAFEAVASLKKHTLYPGKITDDTYVFEMVARKPGLDRDGNPQIVFEQKIPLTRAEYDAAVAEHAARGVGAPMSDVLYGFPNPANPNPCAFNCATYPSRLGIPIPERTGIMRDYIPELEKVGEPWKPK